MHAFIRKTLIYKFIKVLQEGEACACRKVKLINRPVMPLSLELS